MWSTEQLNLYKSLFRGREDVFAVRWEKGGKSGYMPACRFDPHRFKLHKMQGGSFQDYNEKEYLAFTDEQVVKHLNGSHLAGIYPLLKDNTSWFIVADFDKRSWADDSRKFMQICRNKNIPAYLERSRSGKGGHVWIFFEKNYPAFKSRKIIVKLLELAGILSVFDKATSFDRLFPNQDYLTKKGFGNLIALPFHKPALEAGNSCFIDTNTLLPFPDQWKFLLSIERVEIQLLDGFIEGFDEFVKSDNRLPPEKLLIKLSNSVSLNRNAIPSLLNEFLKTELNFVNSEFLIKKRIGKNTWGTLRYFKSIEELGDTIVIPRGFIGKLLRFCRENSISHEFKDERSKIDSINFPSSIVLREYQKIATEATSKKDFGVIVAPPGSGKTIIGLSIIAEKKQPALVIVHRKQLAAQWVDRIETFLGIPGKDIGKISAGRIKIGKRITIALIQSLRKAAEDAEVDELLTSFATIIIDECHHVPAETFRGTIARFNTKYLYGLTATPFRKYNDGKLIFSYIGDVIAEIKATEIENHLKTRIVVRDTELDVPFNIKTDKFETLSRILVHDSARNKLIFNDLTRELNMGKRAIVLTERKDHFDTLRQFLKQSYETVTLSGEDSESGRNIKWKILNEGNYQVLVATGQYFGEGSDLANAHCIFLVYPFSFEGKLVQYIGRVQRSPIDPVIYDYRDYKIDYLERLFQKRNAYYKKFVSEGPLFDFYEPNSTDDKSFTAEEQIRVAMENLEFRFGSVAFKHLSKQLNKELTFEVSNTHIRPEFSVLKPYFARVLKSQKIRAAISIKVDNGLLIYNYASSPDLEKINREVVESAKFQFISQQLFKKRPEGQLAGLRDVKQIQSGLAQAPVYSSGEELLDDFLTQKEVKHYHQLRYLAQKHDGSILKLRFVLSPFSFVFLLTGQQMYHVVWETLDTEEATYVWHIKKTKTELRNTLKQIDGDLGVIRQSGRQAFLKNAPFRFSRILHDYADPVKGFILWRDTLEERLI